MKKISLRLLGGIEEVVEFLTAFITAYEEIGAEALVKEDAERLEKIEPVMVKATVALSEIKDELVHQYSGNEWRNSVVERITGLFRKILSGSGADALARLLGALLQKELPMSLNGDTKSAIAYVAVCEAKRVVSLATMSLKNAPSSPLAIRLVNEGVIARKKDRPMFPSVDTRWAQKSEALNALLDYFDDADDEGRE